MFNIENKNSGAAYEALLTQSTLAGRWLVSEKKLESDRYTGRGCPFIKIGSSVRYRLADVIAFEEANLRRSTSEIGGSK